MNEECDEAAHRTDPEAALDLASLKSPIDSVPSDVAH